MERIPCVGCAHFEFAPEGVGECRREREHQEVDAWTDWCSAWAPVFSAPNIAADHPRVVAYVEHVRQTARGKSA